MINVNIYGEEEHEVLKRCKNKILVITTSNMVEGITKLQDKLQWGDLTDEFLAMLKARFVDFLKHDLGPTWIEPVHSESLLSGFENTYLGDLIRNENLHGEVKILFLRRHYTKLLEPWITRAKLTNCSEKYFLS